MKKILTRLSRRAEQGPDVAFDTPLDPKAPFAAIGDIHGRFDLLTALEWRLGQDHPGVPLVLVGDYIDRGADSRRVLEHLMSSDDGRICLMGNHESMCLDFLDDPDGVGPNWLYNGGLQTLASFGVGGPGSGGDLGKIRDRLAEAMGETMIDWLRLLPLSWQSGNVWVVHAGADPGLPLEAQEADTLLWGDPDFARQVRSDGQWVIHGHTIVDEPTAEDGRIAIDTGAYATGCLTAALVEKDKVTFLQPQEASR